MYYSAQQLVEILNQEEGNEMTLRKIRYYSQIEVLSPPERVNGKQKYTDKHLEELRAIRTMQETGAKLDEIKETISDLDVKSLSDFSQQFGYINKTRVKETFVEYIDEEISIIFDKNISNEKKKKAIEVMKKVSKNIK